MAGWNPKEAKQRIMDLGHLTEKQRKEAEDAAEIANHGPIGAAIRELFEDRRTMVSAMQAMDLTQVGTHHAFHALAKMDRGANKKGVGLGLTMNLVMILRVMEFSTIEILDLVSRATELANLFEDAVLESGKPTPFKLSGLYGED
jgi:hypothetical protein